MTKIHFLSGPRIIIIIQVLRRLVSRLVLLEKKNMHIYDAQWTLK